MGVRQAGAGFRTGSLRRLRGGSSPLLMRRRFVYLNYFLRHQAILKTGASITRVKRLMGCFFILSGRIRPGAGQQVFQVPRMGCFGVRLPAETAVSGVRSGSMGWSARPGKSKGPGRDCPENAFRRSPDSIQERLYRMVYGTKDMSRNLRRGSPIHRILWHRSDRHRHKTRNQCRDQGRWCTCHHPH
jgi:hypothetical protein